MWSKTGGVVAGAALVLAALAAPAGAAGNGGVRVAHDGQGAYHGDHNAFLDDGYAMTVLAVSPSLAEVAIHPWTTCGTPPP